MSLTWLQNAVGHPWVRDGDLLATWVNSMTEAGYSQSWHLWQHSTKMSKIDLETTADELGIPIVAVRRMIARAETEHKMNVQLGFKFGGGNGEESQNDKAWMRHGMRA